MKNSSRASSCSRSSTVAASVSVFLAALCFIPFSQSAPRPAPDTLEERAKPCVACHAAEGRKDKDAYYPRLAGKPGGYLFNQMRHFRDGQRTHRAMALLMENLSDEYLRLLASYFSQLPVRYAPAESATATAAGATPALVRDGDAARRIPGCTSCHGKQLLGIAPVIPGLLGLPRDYISAQFGAWRVGTRHAAAPDCMGEIARQLSQAEVTTIAGWLAAQPLPAGAVAGTLDSVDRETVNRCGSVRDATGMSESVKLPAAKNTAKAAKP